jgi:hypothetical protein
MLTPPHEERGANAAGCSEPGGVLLDLAGQLARGSEHQRSRSLLAGEALHQREDDAAVLPVPVAAQPMTSLPASAGGIARAWMGVGTR